MSIFRIVAKACQPAAAELSIDRRLRFSANRLEQRSVTRAFSLVEVVLALGVVSFALIPMVGMMASGSSLLSNANERHIKARISHFLNEELAEMRFSDLAGNLGSLSYGFDNEGSLLPKGASDVRYIAAFGSPEAPEIAAGQPLASMVRIPVNVDYAANGNPVAGRQSTFFVLVNNRGR